MKLIIHTGLAISFFSLIGGNFTAEAQQAAPSFKEMTIEVQPRTIALPGGATGENIAKVPLASARVRNTELRDLNKLYHAVSIERIYEAANAVAASADGSLLKSNDKKKKKLREKRLLRKTSKGFFESDHLAEGSSGKITKGKKVKVRKKGELAAKENKKKRKKSDKTAGSEGAISEEDISAVKDTFIISFTSYEDTNGNMVEVDLDAAVKAYEALPVVISAVKN